MPMVMLVEDDATMQSLLTTLLELEGFQVVSLPQDKGISGLLNDVCQAKPDLVFLDVHLRQVNGIEVMRGLRDEMDLQNLRVLMTSGMDVGSQCRQAGADDFILKPFMPDDLLIKIRSLLGN